MPNGTAKTNGKNGNGTKKLVTHMALWFHNRVFLVLLICILVGVVAWQIVTVASIMRAYRFIGKSSDVRNTITIEGQGKVQGIPDIATVQLGFTTEHKEVRTAQKENTVTMNKLIAALRKLGIAAEDMQTTNYSIYPQYDYTKETQLLRGYVVSQNVTVKIRDLGNVSAVLDQVGVLGLNQVGGINFTMDDPEVLRQQARVKAMENAKAKAGELARIAGVHLGRVVSFSEHVSGDYPGPFYARAYLEGAGGDGAPDIQAGSQDVIVNATVTYEIE